MIGHDLAVQRVDIAVIGAGIIGLATARALVEQRPGLSVAVVEKEPKVAQHQSGRNSGVIHSGVYYRPGSRKAVLATTGRRRMIDFCSRHGIAHEVTGKVIVATRDHELPALAELERRGTANGVRLEHIGPGRLRELEPHARGIAALHVRDAGVADFARVTEVLAEQVQGRNVELRLAWPVREIVEREREVRLVASSGDVAAKVVVNAAGLHADLLAHRRENRLSVRIVPFRGEYHEVVGRSASLVRALVYPVPDPDLPFLGVHVSRGADGRVRAGPNAVLALAREGYGWSRIEPGEVLDLFKFRGFRQLASRYWQLGLEELFRSTSRHAFAGAVRRLVPDIRAGDLVRSPSGVRAQALSETGALEDDFVYHETRRTVNVLNAPSPGATASLAIGEQIATRALQHLDEHTP